MSKATVAGGALAKDALHFLALGGAGEIGMNLNLYGYGGKWLMVDLGITFADAELPGIDLILPDPAWIAERRQDLVALVITHAHEDHLGAVAYLWPQLRCPVYATAFAAAILKGKLAEVGLEDDVLLHVFDESALLQLGPFKVRAISITHSIPESQALAIETPLGVVLHSGDWKFDPQPMLGPDTDKDALHRYGEEGVLALVCDSTNVFHQGSSGSEADVRRSLLELLAERPGRIIATTFASHVARIKTFAEVARLLDRRLALVGRSLWRIAEIARSVGYMDDVATLLDEREADFLPRNKVMLLCTGCQGEPRGAMARIARGENAAVVAGPGDVVVFSSRIIPGNERQIYEMHNRLAQAGAEVITELDALVHVSGHPGRDELLEMYRLVRPKIAIPVHGENRHMQEQAKLAKSLQVPHVVVPANGDLIRLAPGRPELVDQVHAGRLILADGQVIHPKGPMMQMRRKLMHNGVMLVSLAIDAAARPLGDPQVALVGVVDDPDAAIEERLQTAILGALAKLGADARASDTAIAEALRAAARKVLRAVSDRRPQIEVKLHRLH